MCPQDGLKVACMHGGWGATSGMGSARVHDAVRAAAFTSRHATHMTRVAPLGHSPSPNRANRLPAKREAAHAFGHPGPPAAAGDPRPTPAWPPAGFLPFIWSGLGRWPLAAGTKPCLRAGPARPN
jgi:hypothetical protein